MYRCIVADPPWSNHRGGNTSRYPQGSGHYRQLSQRAIVDVIRTSPLWKPAEQCHLWLWATNYGLEIALQTMDDLGFRYATNFAWVKDKFGIGIYLRNQHELCLLGTRGKPALIPTDRAIPSIVHAPRTRHSEKPKQAFDLIERVSPGPRAELFARRHREGWDVWGDQVA